mgnify:CR=1 FL=1
MNTLIVNQILKSNSCTELDQSTVLSNHLNSFLQREEKVTLDFQNIEKISMLFINSLHNQLYDYNTLSPLTGYTYISDGSNVYYYTLNTGTGQINNDPVSCILPSVTPTSTLTQTPTPTITQTQTITPTETPTVTPTQTVTQTTTNTPTLTPTNTPTTTPTPTPTESLPVRILYYNISDPTSYSGTTTLYDLDNHSNASLVNSPVSADTGCGVSIVFDGVNQYGVTLSDLSPYFSGTSPNKSDITSIFMWIYPIDNGVILSELGSSVINTAWHDSQIEMVGGTLKFGMYSTGGIAAISSTVSTPFNNWYYVGMVYDGTTLKAYVDGVPAGQTSFTRSSPYNNGQSLYYGIASIDNTNMGNGGYGNVKIGSLEIYNTTLSTNQIIERYNNSSNNYICSTPTPTISSTPTLTPTITSTPTLTQTPTLSSGGVSVVNMTLLEVNGDVILSGSGTLNTTSLGTPIPYYRGPTVVPVGGQFGCGIAGSPPFNCSIFTGGTVTGPSNFGTGGTSTGGSGTGDFFGIGYYGGNNDLFVPSGYTSGSFISGSTTFDFTDLATMGATKGTYTWSWGSGANASSIILQIG